MGISYRPVGPWQRKVRHKFDKALASELKNQFAGSSIVDFGCGWDKQYARFLDCDGFDGNENTLDGDVVDLSKPFQLGRQWDVVLCLEVMEHIEKEHEQQVIQNLVEHCRETLVMSWAYKGQRGRGHVNCQDRDYVLGTLGSMGFEYDEDLSETLRTAAKFSWFRKNIVVVRYK
jgi:hypothetical protein